MKYYQQTFLFLLLSIVFFGCDRDKALDKKEGPQKNQEELIKQTLINMWDAIEKEDMERYASFIHPEFTQFGETDSVLRVGKEAEINGIRSWVENSSDIHTEMVDPMVTVNGNVAWIVYYWKDKGTTNGEPFATRGKSTRIFVKENDHWLCIHGHYTLLP
jgi:ketosteroid isomerase-like protein